MDEQGCIELLTPRYPEASLDPYFQLVVYRYLYHVHFLLNFLIATYNHFLVI